MSDLPLLPKATAVWLVDNTTLTFRQIATFTGMHDLEISGIADGEVAIGIKGLDPVMKGQLTREEIARCEADPSADLKLIKKQLAPETKRKAPRYTPLSKRQDRPASILWLVKFHPELSDGQISKLVGTTKPTIQAIRERTHWNISNITPIDPVALGLCKQLDLDSAVAKAAKKAEREGRAISNDEREKLVSTEQSLQMDADAPAQDMPSNISGLENFSLVEEAPAEEPKIDADSFFNLPSESDEDKDSD